MPKPKAESWLTTEFAEGVPELSAIDRPRPRPAYKGGLGRCFLAKHDEHRKPCEGRLERFHFLRRATVEDALWARLCGAVAHEVCANCLGAGDVPGDFASDTSGGLMLCPNCDGADEFLEPLTKGEVDDLLLLAAWDPRNGEVGCEGHHRRYDNHAGTADLIVPVLALPIRTVDFIFDYGLMTQAEDQWPGFNEALVDDRDAGYSDPVSTLPTT